MPTYSPSRLTTYEQCPRQYRYRYIDRIPREDETIESFMGHCVHAALERLYADLQMAKEATLPEILEHYRKAWEAGWHGGIRIVRQEYSAEQYRRLGERCLTAYYHRHVPFDGGTTLGLEAKVAVALDEGGAYTIAGVIDRLVAVGEGRYEIHDYKTGGRLPSQDRLDGDRQLALYQLAVEAAWPDAKEVELVWHYLVFDRVLRSRRGRAELEGLKRETIALIGRIETDTTFAPRESPLCNWCAYQDLCPVRRHLVRREGEAQPDLGAYAAGELVNRYAEVSLRRRTLAAELDAELEALEGALRAAAREQGAEVLFGDAHRVRVTPADDGRIILLPREDR